MKKLYLTLFIGISLILVTKDGCAKFSPAPNKKQTHRALKQVKEHSKATTGHFKNKKPILSLQQQKHRSLRPTLETATPFKKTEAIPTTLVVIEKELTPQTQNNTATTPAFNNRRIHSLISPSNNTFGNASGETEQRHFHSVQGIVKSSLTQAGYQAGLSDELIFQLTTIFAWDIDFATNLQYGDQFTVVYEKKNSTDGQILAAEFVTHGKTYTAIRYQNNEGEINYFSPEGKPMRKAFLSAPVDFIRISSGFDVHRRHPVLNRIRAHKGVDYAARTGTPVKASGNGKVIFLGRKGGYGQVAIIEHGEHYQTLYAHLSGFKHSLKEGDTVEQGQVIGFVGQTGLATGPHLHYEFRVDGVHRNPTTLNNQPMIPLADYKLAEFKSQARPLLAQLYQTKARSLLAKTGTLPLN
jgi:murein DD-endopeptidase MepM/ murein hydrolase activator NlpD